MCVCNCSRLLLSRRRERLAARGPAKGERRARLFWNGRSQAVRLPKEFRFEGDEVLVRKEGDAVILEPIGKRAWPAGYWRWVERHGAKLELGEVAPLGGGLLDVTLDEDT